MSGWQAFRLVPDDVLFFRDGRPSSLGDDHYLRSLFPPLPSTLYGAIRTRRLLDENIALGGLENAAVWSQRLDSLTAELGEWGGFGSLELRGPWLLRGGEPLLPAPFDLAVVEEKAEGQEEPIVKKVLRYRVADEAPGGWSHPLSLPALVERTQTGWQVWKDEEESPQPSAPVRWLLTPQGIESWCRGELPREKDFVHQSRLWTEEPRTGVGLEGKQRTSAEGRLYTFGFIRLRDNVALGFEVRGTGKLKAGGTLRLGGEGRTARLEAVPPLPLPALPDLADGRFRLGFFTPALSAAGAWPPGFTGKAEGRLAGQPCRVRAAICRGAVTVGGWDIAKERPKPLRRAIPAGSVYLCEASGAAELAAAVHGASLNDFGNEHFSRQGFGLVLAARDDQEV